MEITGISTKLAGGETNGISARILHGTNALADWLFIINAPNTTNITAGVTVAAGDAIHFQIASHQDVFRDLVRWTPVLSFTHSRTYTHPGTDGDGVSDYLDYLQGRNPPAGAPTTPAARWSNSR